MPFINGSPLAGLGATPAFEFERPQNQTWQIVGNAMPSDRDGFRHNPIALPIRFPGENPGGYGSNSGYGSYPTGTSDTNSFLSSIMDSLSGLMQQLAAFFTGSGAPVPYQTPQNHFASATAGSTGDPHETFDGTTSAGAKVSDRWDSMTSHGDLLDSDSFRGGYRVSTTTTTPDARGVTFNANATVTTHGGNDSVTFGKDGSYTVTENGRNVALTQGQAMQIGRNETVTLNADKSLTVVETNHEGGTLTTTLSSNGSGVDVKASGSDVDLGGYLVNKTDHDTEPISDRWEDGHTPPDGFSYELPPVRQNPFAPTASPFQYGADTEPLGAGEIEFA